jgi:acyl-CoA reductase-like NAD-dependent aldehyde dehydrogenase
MASPITVQNWIDNKQVAVTSSLATAAFSQVRAPHTGELIAQVPTSTAADVDLAVQSAHKAFTAWSARTVKDRVKVLFRFHSLLISHADELADLIVKEHGKTKAEALASIAKGNETVEYAISLPQLIQGKTLEVSRGVHCQDVRLPLGVVSSIVPL